jgi:hypothetical protein
MRDFILGDLLGILGHQRVLERHLLAAGDGALVAAAGYQVGGEAGAENGIRIELGFQIFEVQGEVQDVGVAWLRGLRDGVVHRAAAGAEEGAADQADTQAADILEEGAALFDFLLAGFE